MAASDATPFPIKNQAFRVVFPILDADGDLVTGATALDSEVSKDQGTFADCTNEATEIATSSGVYYLDLTSTEMNADCVAIIVKTTSTGAKTTTLVLYPVENGLDIPVNTTYFGGSAGTFASGRPEVNTTHFNGTAATTASGRPEVNATHFAGTAYATALAAEVDAVWDEATAGHVAAGTTGLRLTRVPDAAAGGNGGLPTVDASNYIAGIQSAGSLNQLDDLNNISTAQVNTEADTALTDYDPPTRTEATADKDAILAVLPAALTADGNIKADVIRINGNSPAAIRLALTAANMVPGTVDTTGFSPTTTEFEADDITEATADHYNGRIIIFTSGALTGQATSISDYALATGRGHFTVPALTEAPANDVTFIIV